jgi:hypothetical protein
MSENKKEQLKEGEVYNICYPKNEFLNQELMWEIDEILGEVTDVEIIPIKNPRHFNFQINFKSNGTLRSFYLSDLKRIISCFHYVTALNDQRKIYKNSPLHKK